MALSKSDILGIKDLEIKEIEVPEWKASVYIRQLSRAEVDEYMRLRYPEKTVVKTINKRAESEMGVDLFGHDAWLVSRGVCDENGERLFSNSDVKELDKKNANAIGFVASKILDFSGSQEDVETLDDLKN